MGQVFVLPVPWGYQETSFAWAAEGGAGAHMASGWNAPLPFQSGRPQGLFGAMMVPTQLIPPPGPPKEEGPLVCLES